MDMEMEMIVDFFGRIHVFLLGKFCRNSELSTDGP
jgi:hypothetical protein